jgi:hypothetical protein
MGSSGDAAREGDPSPAKAGLWEDFVDIFYAPSSGSFLSLRRKS